MTCVPLSTYIPARISDLLVRMRVALDADDKSYFWDLSEALIEIACVDRASYTLQDFQVRYRDLMREKIMLSVISILRNIANMQCAATNFPCFEKAVLVGFVADE